MSLPLEFQRDVGIALKNSQSPCPRQVMQQDSNSRSRRFNIYRNNRMVSLIDNLKATYPAVCKLVGDKYFSAVAREYVNHHPPTGPVMAEFGEQLGAFISRSPNAEKIPYIADVAALEWARLQAYHARDSQSLSPDCLSSFAADDYESLCFTPHPSLTLLSSDWAVGSLWSATEITDAAPFNVQAAEDVVIVRPAHVVNVQVLPNDGGLLLDRLLRGDSLLRAVTLVSEKNPDFNAGSHLQGLIGLGAFIHTYKKG